MDEEAISVIQFDEFKRKGNMARGLASTNQDPYVIIIRDSILQ